MNSKPTLPVSITTALFSRLKIDTDPTTNLAVFGIEVNDFFITDPSLSECGRFNVDPQATYGVPADWANALRWLNKTLEQACEDAINAGCLHIQNQLGITDGGFAGIFFSDNDNREGLQIVLAHYLYEQLEHSFLN
ncbi:MAG: hypothetical protein CMN84_01435 [Spongiibacteraceae bacterium]|nr:hypothetical protein [Spongiibacteraceae bacterium]|tara:strand:+ start:135 stop:542 length:408 start_codon:yes stop_codon:yes gene_type:complete